MDKAYNKITWVNQPSTASPLGARLLNQQSDAIDVIDSRVVAMDATKLNISVANKMVKSFEFNETTGVIKVTLLDGTVYTWDLNIEKIPVSLSLTSDAVLVLETADGQTYTADLKGLIDTYLFGDSDTVGFQMDARADGKHVTAWVKDGSITEGKLRPNYLADIKVEVAEATRQADRSEGQALLSQSYAVGGSGVREGEDEDNSKRYSEMAREYMDAAQAAANLVVPRFYIDFTTGCLMSDTEAVGMEFKVVDGYFIGNEVKS